MKNVACFETTKKLKEAGFPQPSPTPEQVWFFADGRPFFVASHSQNWYDCVPMNVHGKPQIEEERKQMFPYIYIFAPTATDILAELGDQYNLSTTADGKEWYVQKLDHEGQEADSFYLEGNDNPAEVLALAYLQRQP